MSACTQVCVCARACVCVCAHTRVCMIVWSYSEGRLVLLFALTFTTRHLLHLHDALRQRLLPLQTPTDFGPQHLLQEAARLLCCFCLARSVLCVCTYIMHVHMYMYVCIYVYMYICIFVYVYISMCVCTYIPPRARCACVGRLHPGEERCWRRILRWLL